MLLIVIKIFIKLNLGNFTVKLTINQARINLDPINISEVK